MTIKELHAKLGEIGIAEDQYYFHGLYGSANDDDKLALIMKRGKYTLEYEIYYKDRGEKHVLKIFTIEDEACEYILRQLKQNKEIAAKYQ